MRPLSKFFGWDLTIFTDFSFSLFPNSLILSNLLKPFKFFILCSRSVFKMSFKILGWWFFITSLPKFALSFSLFFNFSFFIFISSFASLSNSMLRFINLEWYLGNKFFLSFHNTSICFVFLINSDLKIFSFFCTSFENLFISSKDIGIYFNFRFSISNLINDSSSIFLISSLSSDVI